MIDFSEFDLLLRQLRPSAQNSQQIKLEEAYACSLGVRLLIESGFCPIYFLKGEHA